MTDPVQPLDPDQVAQQVKNDLNERYAHRVIQTGDDLVEVVADGETDHTISSATAHQVVAGKGFLHRIAGWFQRGLNLFSPDHGEKATIADDVRAIEEQTRDEAVLNQVGGNVTEEIHADLNPPPPTPKEQK